MPLDPQENRAAIEHVTELAVLVALMGVGLAIDRPLRLRDRDSWAAGRRPGGCSAIAMPLCIAAVALLGWGAAWRRPRRCCSGAVLAPTDPVLASDVQVAGPRPATTRSRSPTSVRFTLTSEAGLNDGLAFPFVYAADPAGDRGRGSGWALEWVAGTSSARSCVGVLVGVGVGRVLATVAFRSASDALRVAERGESLLALAALVSAYGVGEVVGGYGFLAVFACAMTFRSAERAHDYHAAMHEVVERLERLLTLFVLLVLGIALTRGLLAAWTGAACIGLALILVVRPLAGLIALAPFAAAATRRADRRERWAAAFFGVRGVGSIYYLAYAAGEADELAADWLWSTVAFTIVASVLVHGVLARPVMRAVEEDNARRG